MTNDIKDKNNTKLLNNSVWITLSKFYLTIFSYIVNNSY